MGGGEINVCIYTFSKHTLLLRKSKQTTDRRKNLEVSKPVPVDEVILFCYPPTYINSIIIIYLNKVVSYKYNLVYVAFVAG